VITPEVMNDPRQIAGGTTEVANNRSDGYRGVRSALFRTDNAKHEVLVLELGRSLYRQLCADSDDDG
jgi:hypothetical protein